MHPATEPRPLHEISLEIMYHVRNALLKRPGHTPHWVHFSIPYLKAMRRLSSIHEMYGVEDGHMIVLYALNNLTSWRGEDARRLKAELNLHLPKGN